MGDFGWPPGNTLQNALGGYDLIRTHDEQLPVDIKHAVLCEDVEKYVLRKERPSESGQVSDGAVLGISPPTGERKAVRCLLAWTAVATFGQMSVAHRVAVVLGECAIRNDE